ncbi:MAG: hypothetical protein QGI21_06875 [Candidatus Poseidoniaceae archaeon]|nr:hypothetical protein [Candidatus Poseidoniaceae archaeon]
MSASESVSMEAVQAFFDEVVELELSKRHNEWYQVDVAAVLDGCSIQGHEVDSASGDSLIFLKNSLIFCSPELGVMRHYPRNLVHCFTEDLRNKPRSDNPSLVFRGELFSITPKGEQLCWVRDCISEHEIPKNQSAIAKWMRWLNKA